MINRNNFFTSNWEFDESELDLRGRFQMVNVAILLSSTGLIFGLIGNILKDVQGIIVPIEIFLLLINIALIFLLRQNKERLKFVSFMITFQFSLFFLFLIYAYEPSQMKHIWVLTYPIILLYLQDKKYCSYWLFFMIFMIMLTPLQGLIEVSYSLYQVTYLNFVLVIISLIIYFYQHKMQEGQGLILKQQKQLQDTIDELSSKDKLLTLQSKQAVMGEMISMIAHQWRQPLSTVTLSISNLQLKRMLDKEFNEDELDNALVQINDTVVYLSETIDDFQTYFNPNKELSQITTQELLQKVMSLIQGRINTIEIVLKDDTNEMVTIYVNELIQVVLNIVNNAIDALKEVDRSDAKIIIEVLSDNDYIKFIVKDNANGISSENIDRIFEPYFSTKGKNGTGLGLYMSQMIMQKQFNSKIDVQSSEKGTSFIIRVPKKLS
ncbi:GHKL domain-containing protein [Sulfurimonas aquatica]|uniref:histidine kinase n=1 Tax=Sulfurimonas aquatica TaxID=2672570 RepID=A0A975B1E3_9BACT|nr:HAMP domain-containing sensor histidine kinase [Sulfurimonas aquatica]QSZ42461.1 GHKL domain-containing protein [Sulfurimonas aquatica]